MFSVANLARNSANVFACRSGPDAFIVIASSP